MYLTFFSTLAYLEYRTNRIFEYFLKPGIYVLDNLNLENFSFLISSMLEVDTRMRYHIQLIYSCFGKGCPKKAKSVRDNPERWADTRGHVAGACRSDLLQRQKTCLVHTEARCSRDV